MDLSIPEMEPFDFVSTLEKRFPHFSAPIVVASGHEDASKIARCLGAIATLQKPFQLDELSMTIFAVLESAEERRAMGQHKPLSREITL
jgi:DNA-binding NarL/FixJ family response regulator